jgi:hypothetical protein
VVVPALQSPTGKSSHLAPAQQAALAEQSAFLTEFVATDSVAVTTALARLGFVDDQLAQTLFLHTLPAAWSALSAADHVTLSGVVARLLPRDDLLKQLRMRPNAVVTLLGAFERCEAGGPELRPELVAYLGRTFGAWQSAARLLDKQVARRGDDTLAVRALLELYADLNERDVCAGIVQVRAASLFTAAGMALEQYGLWPRAQDEFYNAMRSVQEPGQWYGFGKSVTGC